MQAKTRENRSCTKRVIGSALAVTAITFLQETPATDVQGNEFNQIEFPETILI